jgi:hypothetical protein
MASSHFFSFFHWPFENPSTCFLAIHLGFELRQSLVFVGITSANSLIRVNPQLVPVSNHVKPFPRCILVLLAILVARAGKKKWLASIHHRLVEKGSVTYM